jgi:hypothetical protein
LLTRRCRLATCTGIDWGFHQLLPLDELQDASRGWLHDGALSLEVLVAPSQATVRVCALRSCMQRPSWSTLTEMLRCAKPARRRCHLASHQQTTAPFATLSWTGEAATAVQW